MADAPEVLKHIGQLAHVACYVQLEIVLEWHASEGCPHDIRVVAQWQFLVVKLYKQVELLVEKDAFANKKFGVDAGVTSAHQRLKLFELGFVCFAKRLD